MSLLLRFSLVAIQEQGGQRWGLRDHQKSRKSCKHWAGDKGWHQSCVGMRERAVCKCRIAWQEDRQLRNYWCPHIFNWMQGIWSWDILSWSSRSCFLWDLAVPCSLVRLGPGKGGASAQRGTPLPSLSLSREWLLARWRPDPEPFPQFLMQPPRQAFPLFSFLFIFLLLFCFQHLL